MRRSIYALSLALSSFALVACEDGPNQPYQPSPAGAAQNWNNGGTPPAIDPATQGFVSDGGSGATKVEICPGQQKHDRWTTMVQQPIVPPTSGAGIDMAGGPTWKGLTIEEADQINCQSDPVFGDGNVSYNSWGDSAQVQVGYYLSTHKIFYMAYQAGYTGKIEFSSRDKAHKYSIGINAKIQLDGQPVTLDWTGVDKGSPNADLVSTVEPMVDALFATFTPGLPPDAHCLSSRHCKVATFSDGSGYMFVPAIGWAFRVQSVTAPQPTPSVVFYMDEYLEKTLPYSYASPMLKLDDEGPVATANNLGTGKNCSMRLTSDTGKLTYGDFLGNCIRVTGTAADDTEENKLLGGMQHGTERFHFNVSGVDLNFTDNHLAADKIITDSDRPSATDEATSWSMDQSTLGLIANEYAGNNPFAATPSHDFHGSGLVYLEFARLVQEYLQRYRPQGSPLRTLGDPSCLAPALGYQSDGSVDPTVPIPAGCTGFEGFVTLAPKATTATSTDPTIKRISYDRSTLLNAAATAGNADAKAVVLGLQVGLAAGSPQAVFCGMVDDGTGLPVKCNATTLWNGSYQRVIQIFGHGKPANLPLEVQDRRFFWRMYATALFKYLHVAGNPAATADDVHNVVLQANDLFFDSSGTGQYETAEYVDRRFVSAGQDPTDINITADILNGIFNDYAFSRDLFRGEQMLYQAIQCTSTDTGACAPGDQAAPYLGQEENRSLLTNLFGSPILSATYKDILGADKKTVQATAYHCATVIDPVNCVDRAAGKYSHPPLITTSISCTKDLDCPATTPTCNIDGTCAGTINDESGKPLLAGYPGAMGGKSTVFTLGASPMKVVQTYDSIESVMVEFNFHQDPYDMTSPYAGKAVDKLIPWVTKQPGSGFAIPLDGVHDKFIQTYQADFSGTTITGSVDYDVDTTGKVTFKAVETTDFLGDVFVCRDSATGDILPARMYSSVSTILDWFAKHPGAYDGCSMITRYSPFDNYADYITSLANGVRLSVTQGGGYGRIVDVTLFTPGQ